jgi:hypothetical protein
MAGITGTFKAVKRGGQQIHCPHCRHREFNRSPNPLGGVNLVCRKCHLSLWFVHEPKAL